MSDEAFPPTPGTQGSSLEPERLELILSHAHALQVKALNAAYQIAAEKLQQQSPRFDEPLKLAVDVIHHAMDIASMAEQMLTEVRPLLQQIEQEAAQAQRAQLDAPLH